ncbi:iron complex outermembrane receptor protein [Novosphingobium sp. SG720]|nr:iron complex outermembrane receptor protein [Novosphingobium sp. SG720]
MKRIPYMMSTSLLAALAAAQPAFAQESTPPAPEHAASDTGNAGLQEIIVTAERRFNTAQRTAAAISVRTGADLQLQGRYELKNILEDVPGVSGGASFGVNTSQAGGTDNAATGLVFRGIQSNSGVGGSATSTAAAAAIYVDDVYNGIGGGYDIGRVEVLRGPQGTLYGRSATAGVVAIHTNDPDSKAFAVNATAEIGNYNLRRFSGEVNLPLVTDKLALRVSGNHFERDGYYTAQGDARRSTSFRGKLLWTPTENFSALLGYAQEFNQTRSGGVAVSQGSSPTDFVFVPQAVGTGRNHFRQYWANFNLDLGAVAVTYIPAYRTWYQNATTIARSAPPGPNIDNFVYVPKDNFMTHEVRIRSTATDSKLRWQAGFMYYRNALSETNNLFNLDLPPAGAYLFKSNTHKVTTAEGVFAEATYSFTPETRLTAGLRYDHTKIEVDQDYTGFTGITASLSGPQRVAAFNNVTYKARLEHDVTPQNLVYASISTGFSPGDTSLTQDLAGVPQVQVLKAQTLTAYEVGTKNRFLNNRLQLNLAGFYNDYGGYQTAGINVAPPGPLRIFQTITVPVKTYGFEFELQARPWARGTFQLNGSYTHARYGDFGIYAAYFSTHEVSPSPPWQVAASYDHRLNLGDTTFVMRGALRFVSAHDSSRITVQQALDGASPYIRVPTVLLADLNANWIINDHLSIAGYVRNLTDKRYLPDNWNVAQVTAGNPPVVTVSANSLSEPRTFGMLVDVKF